MAVQRHQSRNSKNLLHQKEEEEHSYRSSLLELADRKSRVSDSSYDDHINDPALLVPGQHARCSIREPYGGSRFLDRLHYDGDLEELQIEKRKQGHYNQPLKPISTSRAIRHFVTCASSRFTNPPLSPRLAVNKDGRRDIKVLFWSLVPAVI